MSKIIIEATTSYLAEEATIALLKGGFVAQTARISYSLNRGLPRVENVDEYPLVLEGRMGDCYANIHVYSVTAGYGGSGPHAMLNILKTAAFHFDDTDIISSAKVGINDQIDLFYKR